MGGRDGERRGEGWGGRARSGGWGWGPEGGEAWPGLRVEGGGIQEARAGGLARGLGDGIQDLRGSVPLTVRRTARAEAVDVWARAGLLPHSPSADHGADSAQALERARLGNTGDDCASRPPGLPRGGRVASIPRVLAVSWREEQGWGGRAWSPRAHFP